MGARENIVTALGERHAGLKRTLSGFVEELREALEAEDHGYRLVTLLEQSDRPIEASSSCT